MGQPIAARSCYSWLAALSDTAESYTAPLGVCRLTVGDNRT
uniref:Uncharacterized protein n=1 Tax=uncultured bacterium esnapd9 TaxID=1366616 RepID=S5TME9_9BACT|nr:hypothetical protein [uncultured bacterium esnapd9]